MINKKTFNQQGFLLLEALIASTILSIGLVIIIHSFTNSIYAAKLSKDYMSAISYLEEQLEEIDKNGLTPTGNNDTTPDQFELITNITPVIVILPPIEDDNEQSATTKTKEEEKKMELDKLEATLFWKTKRKVEAFNVTTYIKKKQEIITEEDETSE